MEVATAGDAMKKSADHITVCICTYKRPHLVARLLKHLDGQPTNGLFTFSAVIVDNDASRSARSAVEAAARDVSFPIAYHCEPEQNIALARNRAVQNADGRFLALIDDDEIPGRQWLLTLYRAVHAFGADGVLGPVLPYSETEPPHWIVKGKFYERHSPATGTVLDWTDTRTGNALLRRSIFETPDSLFRKEYGRGGEDRDFFQRMIRGGRTFVWTADAEVYELVPPQRFSRSFMIRRALLRGSKPGFSARELAKSALAVPVYTCLLPFLLLLGQHVFMKYLIKDFDHIGRILAACGFDVIKQKYVME